jgi:hypothetical protein
MLFSPASPAPDPRAAAVLPALAAAAQRTGVDFSTLYQTARVESGFNPTARAGLSSAAGLFQFVDSTWLRALDRHGARHGIAPASRQEALALRDDPYVAALMAAEHMADNSAFLERQLGRATGPVDLYLAHFLGAAGAVKFLGAMAADPTQPAAALLPAAAQSNRPIFYKGAAPRSLAEVHALLAERLGTIGGTAVPPAATVAGTPVPQGRNPADAADTDDLDLLAVLPPEMLDRLPPRIAAQMLGRSGSATAGYGAGAVASDPRTAARAAYLILAELGA